MSLEELAVSLTSVKAVAGGYLNELKRIDVPCVPGCNYWVKLARSAMGSQASTGSDSVLVKYKVCVQ